MPPNKRDQADQNVLLLLRDWLRKLSSLGIARPERWKTSLLARTLVIVTLLLWLLIFLLNLSANYEQEVPALPLLPLYAFVPGEIVSGQADSNPTLLHIWGIGAAIVFLLLAYAGMRHKNKTAAAAFMALFLISTLIVYARVVAEVRFFNLH
ncbi:MAG: hypothetical protein WBN22_03365 [Verrucomicrobiia bacterium]